MLKLKIKQLIIAFLLVIVALGGIFNFVASQTASAAKSEAEQWFTRLPSSSYTKDDLTDFAYFLAGEANGGKQGFRGCQDRDAKTGNPNLSSQYIPFFSEFINDLQNPDQSKVKDFTSKAVKTLQQSSATYQSGGAGNINQQCDNIAHYGIENGINYAGVPTGSAASKEDVLSKISQLCSGNIETITGVSNAGHIEQVLKQLSDSDYKKIAGYYGSDVDPDHHCNDIAATVGATFATYTKNQLNTICKNDPDTLAEIKKLNDKQSGEVWDQSNNDCSAVKKYLAPQVSSDVSAGPQCGVEGTSMSWIICPIFNLTKSAGDIMNSAVTSHLETDTDLIFGGSNASNKKQNISNHYKDAWSSMRNIALIVIIIAGLVMIIAQAIGSQAVDAYTIKSVMPRLLIAAILISLSWIIMEFCVDITNLLGEGIRELIYSPFSGLTGDQGAVLSGQNAITILTSGVAVVGGIILLLAFAGTIALSLFVGFIVIVLRQILLVFLIIVAPIAIALYALPNTKKAFSMWWDNFIKLLLMFPLIVGFIAVGRVFSAVSLGQGGFWNSVVATLAYIIPFFLLPMTFKFAGSAMGGIAQGVHGFGQRMNAGIKKRRGERWAGRREKLKNGELFSEQTPFKRLNRIGSRVNKIGAGVGHGGFWGAYGLNKLGKANLERLSTAQRDEKMKIPGAQAMLQDDDVRMALFSGNADEAQELIDDMVAKGSMTKEKGRQVMAAAKSIGFDGASRLAAWQMESAQGKGRALNALAKFTGKTHTNQMKDLVHSIAEDTGVDEDRLLNDSMYAFGAGGRADLRQPSVGAVLDQKVDGQMVATATDAAITNLGGEMVTRLKAGPVVPLSSMSPSMVAQKKRAAAQMLMTEENRSRMSEPTRTAWTKQMESAGIDYSSQTPIEMQLAMQIDQVSASSYLAAKSHVDKAQSDLRVAQQKVNDEVSRNGTATAASMAALDMARSDLATANSYAQPHLDTLSKLATEIRATSSTYGSTTPRAAREEIE